jgi:ABC-type amino acid transport system permease subunit
MTVAAKISDYTFKPIEIMSVVGLVYLLLNLLVARLARWLEVATRIPR